MALCIISSRWPQYHGRIWLQKHLYHKELRQELSDSHWQQPWESGNRWGEGEGGPRKEESAWGGEAWRKSKEKVKVKLKKSWMQPFQLIPKPAAISVHRAPLQIKCRKWNGETFWLQSFHITSDINYFPSSDSLSYRRQWAPVLQNRAWTLLDTVYDSQQVSKPASHSPYWYTVFTVLHILYTLFGNEMN